MKLDDGELPSTPVYFPDEHTFGHGVISTGPRGRMSPTQRQRRRKSTGEDTMGRGQPPLFIVVVDLVLCSGAVVG